MVSVRSRTYGSGLVALVVAVTLTVTGCGGDKEATPPPDPPAEPAAPPPAEPTAPEPAGAGTTPEQDVITITWDGSSCTLSGPASVSLREPSGNTGLVDVRAVNASDDWAVTGHLDRLADGYTLEDVASEYPGGGQQGIEFGSIENLSDAVKVTAPDTEVAAVPVVGAKEVTSEAVLTPGSPLRLLRPGAAGDSRWHPRRDDALRGRGRRDHRAVLVSDWHRAVSGAQTHPNRVDSA
jgi:hypothetical protein